MRTKHITDAMCGYLLPLLRLYEHLLFQIKSQRRDSFFFAELLYMNFCSTAFTFTVLVSETRGPTTKSTLQPECHSTNLWSRDIEATVSAVCCHCVLLAKHMMRTCCNQVS
jgi:hypothetical protein